MLRQTEIEALVARIVALLEPERVIVFGSYAKGVATPRSDLDLMVVKDTPLPPARRADGVRPLIERSLVPVDVHVYTPEEIEEYGREPLSFVDSVIKTGRVLYERVPA